MIPDTGPCLKRRVLVISRQGTATGGADPTGTACDSPAKRDDSRQSADMIAFSSFQRASFEAGERRCMGRCFSGHRRYPNRQALEQLERRQKQSQAWMTPTQPPIRSLNQPSAVILMLSRSNASPCCSFSKLSTKSPNAVRCVHVLSYVVLRSVVSSSPTCRTGSLR